MKPISVKSEKRKNGGPRNLATHGFVPLDSFSSCFRPCGLMFVVCGLCQLPVDKSGCSHGAWSSLLYAPSVTLSPHHRIKEYRHTDLRTATYVPGTVQNPEPSAKFLCAVPRFSKPGSATRTFALRSFCAAQKATRSILILSWEWRCWTKLVSRPSDSRPLACAAALAGSVPRCRPQRRSNRRSSRSCNGVASFLLKALKV